jgi:hypothetical protein
MTEISLSRPGRSREWLTVALLECERCHQIVERASPIQRHCRDCRRTIKGARSREAVRRSRIAGRSIAPKPAADEHGQNRLGPGLPFDAVGLWKRPTPREAAVLAGVAVLR